MKKLQLHSLHNVPFSFFFYLIIPQSHLKGLVGKRKWKEKTICVYFSWISMLNFQPGGLLLLHSEYFISFQWTLCTCIWVFCCFHGIDSEIVDWYSEKKKNSICSLVFVQFLSEIIRKNYFTYLPFVWLGISGSTGSFFPLFLALLFFVFYFLFFFLFFYFFSISELVINCMKLFYVDTAYLVQWKSCATSTFC